jgi:NADH-quinone oxidoreductase subunit G
MKSSKNKIGIIAGKFTDIESLLLSKTFLNLNGSSFLFNEDLFSSQNFNLNFSFNYKFNTTLNLIEKSDLCFLVQTNPRKEAAVLNIRLRKQVHEGRMLAASVGPFEAPTFDCKFLGLSSNNFYSVLEGNHYFSRDIQNSLKPLIIFGNNTFKTNSSQFYSLLKSNLNTGFSSSYNFINFLSTNMGLINSCEIGLKSINFKKLQSLNVVFLLNTSSFDTSLLNKKTKVIYIGSHGPQNVSSIDLLLPGVSAIENDAHFLNINSFLQKTKKASMLKKDCRYD